MEIKTWIIKQYSKCRRKNKTEILPLYWKRASSQSRRELINYSFNTQIILMKLNIHQRDLMDYYILWEFIAELHLKLLIRLEGEGNKNGNG